jgi:hypothetical protein
MPRFTIAAAASLSDAKLISGPIIGFDLPASLEGTVLTFQAADPGGTHKDVYDAAGAEVDVAVSSSRYVACLPADFAWATGKSLKIRTGTAAAPVVQVTTSAVIDCDLGNLP